MKITQIDQKNRSTIQSENSPDKPIGKFKFDTEALINLETQGYGWDECVIWWREKYKLLTEDQKIETIKYSKNWLQTSDNKYWQTDYGYCWYLNLIDLYGSELQKQEAIAV